MKIRELKTSDLSYLANIMESVSADLVDKLDQEISEKKAGFQIFLSVARAIPNEIREFFAHITDMTVEEYDEQPIAFPLKVAKALFDKEEIKDFFTEIKDLIAKVTSKQ